MAEKEIIERIKRVKEAIFMTEMIDHWSSEDSERYSKLCSELLELETQLKEE